MFLDPALKMACLVTSSEALDLKLKKALGLCLKALPFEAAMVYLPDDDTGGLRLGASVFSSQGNAECTAPRHSAQATEPDPCEGPVSYGPCEGLGLFVLKTGSPLAITRDIGADTVYKGIYDSGLEGFRTILIHPLIDGIRPYGVIYLKGRERTTISGDKEAFLRLALLYIVSMIKFSEVVDDCREAVDEAEALRQRLDCAGELLLLGDMAASLAHEIKNPLLCLGGYAARIKRKLEPGSAILGDVEELLKAVRRIEGVINTMVAPLRRESAPGETSELNEAMNEAVERFREEMRRRAVKLVCEFAEGSLPVRAGREELKIIFDNLISNALQCMDKGGGLLRLCTTAEEGWVVAEVSDSGGGIDPRYLASIFRPFFTTKKDGTGLGLPITSSIVSRLRGVIDVINDVGEGVTFRVKLPAQCPDDDLAREAQR